MCDIALDLSFSSSKMRALDYILGLDLHFSLLQAAQCPVREAHPGKEEPTNELGHTSLSQVRGSVEKHLSQGQLLAVTVQGAREEQINGAIGTGTQAVPYLVREKSSPHSSSTGGGQRATVRCLIDQPSSVL